MMAQGRRRDSDVNPMFAETLGTNVGRVAEMDLTLLGSQTQTSYAVFLTSRIWLGILDRAGMGIVGRQGQRKNITGLLPITIGVVHVQSNHISFCPT